jgi:hypothetical protein
MESLQQIAAVLAVFGLLGGALWWLRSRGLASFAAAPSRRKGGLIECIERVPLTPAHTLHLVRLGSRTILIATSPAGCQVVTEDRE